MMPFLKNGEKGWGGGGGGGELEEGGGGVFSPAPHQSLVSPWPGFPYFELSEVSPMK